MKNKTAMRYGPLWVLTALVLTVSGCVTSQHTHNQPAPMGNPQAHSWGTLPGAVSSGFQSGLDTDYLLSPGDKVELTYHIDVKKIDKYFLEVGDQIRVEFFHYPQLDRTLNVRPDGRVTLPNIGDIDAQGFTAMELADKICKAYAKQLREPMATVSLIRYGEKYRELKDALSTSQRGQSRLLLVQPDGKVSIPFLPVTKVVGLTITEFESMINDAYKEVITGMSTTAALTSATGNRIYVYGEVRKPGYYQLNGPTSVTQSIALAGGLENYADAKNILLITRDQQNRAIGRQVDINGVLSQPGVSGQTIVRQGDVVFVSKSKLGRASLIGDAIKKMIPINLSLFYNLAEQN